jgi:tRNA1Val (adenine37-N6)-methyltransferase
MFHFKQFSVLHEKSSMKVGTDAVLLGCLAGVSGTSVLEAGCGCGVISLMFAQRFPNLKITAIDIHKPSVDEAFENFQNSKWKDRLVVEHKSLQEFSETCFAKFDTIVSNPPFFSKSLQSPNTARTNARHTTTLSYDDLILCSEKLLTQQGNFFVLIPTLEYANFQNSISQSKLHIHEALHLFGANQEKSKRVILGCGFEQKLSIEKRYSYFDNYLELTKDFLL